MDNLYEAGGLRQRHIRPTANTVTSVLAKGFDDSIGEEFCFTDVLCDHTNTHNPLFSPTGTLCVCEPGWTDDEWADIVREKKLADNTPKPQRLQDKISANEWSSGRFFDLDKLPREEQYRKFLLVDGNHRIWILLQVVVGA